MHLAARASLEWCRRTYPGRARLRANPGARWPPVLWLGRDLFAHPARALRAIARAQDRDSRRRRAGPDRHGQHRLPHAPSVCRPDAGRSVDRAAVDVVDARQPGARGALAWRMPFFLTTPRAADLIRVLSSMPPLWESLRPAWPGSSVGRAAD